MDVKELSQQPDIRLPITSGSPGIWCVLYARHFINLERPLTGLRVTPVMNYIWKDPSRWGTNTSLFDSYVLVNFIAIQ